MQVTLLPPHPLAVATLIFTKSTRLSVNASGFEAVCAKIIDDPAWARSELEYMAGTIPSSWEFVDYIFVVEGVSRAYTHQQVRTRAGSYAQQTMRVTDMAEFDYVFSDRIEANPEAKFRVREVLDYIKAGYWSLTRDLGIPAEDARGILPTNIATNIVCKFNLRTLAELARSRTGGRTQSEYQKVVNGMIDAVLAVHPWAEMFLFPKGRNVFDDIEAFAKEEWPDDLLKRGRLLKLVDKLRKEIA
jgi:thymidylate synthase (FAD)